MKRREPNREVDSDDKSSHRRPTPDKTHPSPTNPLLHLQRTVGNRTVSEILGSPTQQKIRVSQPGEPAEVEADHVAAESEPGNVDSKDIHAAAAGSNNMTEVPTSHPALNLGPGEAMDPAVRSSMEARFGHDFSNVRIHNDSNAAESARAMGARAYTLGKNVVFDAGEYAPEKPGGKQLLAHELTHVVQQGVVQRRTGSETPAPKTVSRVPSGKVIQRQPQPEPKPGTSSTSSPAPAPAPAPKLTQVFYDQAIAVLAKLPGADPTLLAILKQGKVGQTVSGVKIVASGPQPTAPTAPPAQVTFDLEISPTTANLPQSAAAQFVEDPKNQTNIQSDPVKGILVTRQLKIIAKPAATVNEMAWSLLHEGIHMLLGIDRTLDFVAGVSPGVGSGATGALKTLAQYQQAGRTSSKRASLVSAMVTEINRVKALSAPPPSTPAPSSKPPASSTPAAPPPTSAPTTGPSASDIADDVIDEILEERFAYDQQLKQFPGSKTVANSLLADAYMFDELAFGLGLKSWPTPPNRQSLVNLMAAFLADVELILNPPATPSPTPKNPPPVAPKKN